eukprot:TRINITY_DN19074_c0_g2_i1.p1 TRINITY_DN19074_c0_g2~~TRINITY_DN19074_c0_g2_i1.p1  ORF type:complete len:1739 (+),score=461.91 TRINITY_DN19074_c0_g2_i1:519-5219(+)
MAALCGPGVNLEGELREAGAGRLLVAVLRIHVACGDVARDCCHALRALLADPSAAAGAACDGALPALTLALARHEGDLQVVRDALATLLLISRIPPVAGGTQARPWAEWPPQALELLLKVARLHAWHAPAAESAAQLICSVCRDQGNREQMVAGAGDPALSALAVVEELVRTHGAEQPEVGSAALDAAPPLMQLALRRQPLSVSTLHARPADSGSDDDSPPLGSGAAARRRPAAKAELASARHQFSKAMVPQVVAAAVAMMRAHPDNSAVQTGGMRCVLAAARGGVPAGLPLVQAEEGQQACAAAMLRLRDNKDVQGLGCLLLGALLCGPAAHELPWNSSVVGVPCRRILIDALCACAGDPSAQEAALRGLAKLEQLENPLRAAAEGGAAPWEEGGPSLWTPEVKGAAVGAAAAAMDSNESSAAVGAAALALTAQIASKLLACAQDGLVGELFSAEIGGVPVLQRLAAALERFRSSECRAKALEALAAACHLDQLRAVVLCTPLCAVAAAELDAVSAPPPSGTDSREDMRAERALHAATVLRCISEGQLRDGSPAADLVALGPYDGAGALARALGAFRRDQAVASACVGALRALVAGGCFEEGPASVRALVCESGGAAALVDALRVHRGSADLQGELCHVLAALSCGGPRCTDQLAQAGAPRAIADTMGWHLGEPSVQREGCCALANLGGPAAGRHCLLAMVGAFRSFPSDREIAPRAVAAVRDFARQLAAEAEGAGPAERPKQRHMDDAAELCAGCVLDAMAAHADEPGLQADACAAVAALASLPWFAEHFAYAASAASCRAALRWAAAHREVREGALRALRHLSAAAASATPPGGLHDRCAVAEAVVACLAAGRSAQVARDAFAALKGLCALAAAKGRGAEAELRAHLGVCGAGGVVLDAMRTHSGEAEEAPADACVQQEAAACLQFLCSGELRALRIDPFADTERRAAGGAAALGLELRGGCVARSVRPGGAAALAGLVAGMELVAVEGKAVYSEDEASAALRVAAPGKEVEVIVREPGAAVADVAAGGGLYLLLAAMVRHPRNAGIAEACCAALLCLAAGSGAACRELATVDLGGSDPSAVEALLGVLRFHEARRAVALPLLSVVELLLRTREGTAGMDAWGGRALREMLDVCWHSAHKHDALVHHTALRALAALAAAPRLRALDEAVQSDPPTIEAVAAGAMRTFSSGSGGLVGAHDLAAFAAAALPADARGEFLARAMPSELPAMDEERLAALLGEIELSAEELAHAAGAAGADPAPEGTRFAPAGLPALAGESEVASAVRCAAMLMLRYERSRATQMSGCEVMQGLAWSQLGAEIVRRVEVGSLSEAARESDAAVFRRLRPADSAAKAALTCALQCHRFDRDVVVAALGVLCDILPSDPVSDPFCKHPREPLVQALVDALSDHPKDRRVVACAAEVLGYLALAGPHRVTISAQGGGEALLAAMRMHARDSATVRPVAAALARAAENLDCRRALSLQGCREAAQDVLEQCAGRGEGSAARVHASRLLELLPVPVSVAAPRDGGGAETALRLEAGFADAQRAAGLPMRRDGSRTFAYLRQN